MLDDVGSGQWFPPATTQHQPALPCPPREPEEVQSRFMTSLIGATNHFTFTSKRTVCKSCRNVVTSAIAWFRIQNAPSVFLPTLTSACRLPIQIDNPMFFWVSWCLELIIATALLLGFATFVHGLEWQVGVYHALSHPANVRTCTTQ